MSKHVLEGIEIQIHRHDSGQHVTGHSYDKDDFVASDQELEEDAFDPVPPRRRPPPKRRQQTLDELGPPIASNTCLRAGIDDDGVAEGSSGRHCAAICGIHAKVIERAGVAKREWEHTSRLKESLERAKTGCYNGMF
ncbi:uncharacterized protein B0T15DRAFT_489656 [Chaetomium strumarium]|uniref:Uncharacterized protein n=1 Tax=Chaetomium strumarium TaxID=1170767 RepID=A0AAJ0H3T1_9PEZI|nr:hypothetical protein B0T15DRAFT_489656 [Chaetomium strumarium]